MPQLDHVFYISQVFWLTISFAILYFFIKYWFAPRMQDIFLARKDKINSLMLQAQNLRDATQANNLKYLNELKSLHLKLSVIDSETESFCSEHYSLEMTKLNDEFLQQREKFFQDLLQWQKEFERSVDVVTIELAKEMLESITKGDVGSDNISHHIQEVAFDKYYNKIKNDN
jgi:F-type H+-transporting ATPase subunit b